MSRENLTRAFWEKKEPSVESMMLRNQALGIDEEERPEILSYLPVYEEKEVLELGAGIGRFTGAFAQVAKHVTAVDFIRAFIEENQKRHTQFSNISYSCQDIMDLNFPDKSADLIFINWLMMYLENPQVETLAERLCHWLKPGGHLFFRESCSTTEIVREGGYHAWYRTLAYYTDLFRGKLKLVKQDNIRTYIYRFADPFQCYWLFSK